ncbi:uncharacterized protein LOC133848205 [Drosophila sulfurigaster albostrigata]|uniref:uncharacterized protein LOC133848205 n=1 Tax=Drosophila sulfurigaster albostrigata TaxID=89887 RepID=UPI002D219269|nr:uncharacterized protein LOC133848205 [Drosophila sulfurigaster albostrigata]
MGKKFIIFGILVWITLNLSCNDAVVFKFTNAVCESYNKSWIVINHCRLHAISRNKTVFNFNGTVLYPCNDIFIEAQIFKKANGYKPWLFKTTVDACRFVKKYNPVAILVYNLFKEFTNVNHTCPYVFHNTSVYVNVSEGTF